MVHFKGKINRPFLKSERILGHFRNPLVSKLQSVTALLRKKSLKIFENFEKSLILSLSLYFHNLINYRLIMRVLCEFYFVNF